MSVDKVIKEILENNWGMTSPNRNKHVIEITTQKIIDAIAITEQPVVCTNPAHDDIYEDVYEQCQELINPHIVQMPYGSACGDESLTASVVGSLSYLIDFWLKHRDTKRESVGDNLPAGMVKISKLISDLQSTMDRFGDTCVYIKPGVSWGAVAMNRRDDDAKAIEETAASFANTFKPEYKELAQQIMNHAISEGWVHRFAASQIEGGK